MLFKVDFRWEAYNLKMFERYFYKDLRQPKQVLLHSLCFFAFFREIVVLKLPVMLLLVDLATAIY
jgi:hypothetical protein